MAAHAARRLPPDCFLPDRISEAAVREGWPCEWVWFRNRWRTRPEGLGDREFEALRDLEVFDTMFASPTPSAGRVWLVVDECLGRPAPFEATGDRLRTLVAETGCDLRADAVFIWETTPRISMIHHEGGFCHVVPRGSNDVGRAPI